MRTTKNLIAILMLTFIITSCEKNTPDPVKADDKTEESQDVQNEDEDSSLSFIGEWQTDSLRDVYGNHTDGYDTIFYEGSPGDGFTFRETEIDFTIFSDDFTRSYTQISTDSLKIEHQNGQHYFMLIDTLNEANMVVTEVYDESWESVNKMTLITHYLTRVE